MFPHYSNTLIRLSKAIWKTVSKAAEQRSLSAQVLHYCFWENIFPVFGAWVQSIMKVIKKGKGKMGEKGERKVEIEMVSQRAACHIFSFSNIF